MSELQAVGREIWCVDRPRRVAGMQLGQRMTVVRLAGGLWVHAPVEWTASLGAELGSLGEVRHVVAPSCRRDFPLDGWRAHCRTALFWGAPGLPAVLGKFPFSGELTSAPHAEWAGGLEQEILGGLPRWNEVVFLHRPSRSLIVTGLAGNLVGPLDALTRTLATLNGCAGRFGPSRVYKAGIRDKAAFAASLRRILAWDFDRVIVGQGALVEQGGRHALAAAYAWLPDAFPVGGCPSPSEDVPS
ncbi:MAG: DUF4336 domain-containing protein [Verrucomicrobiota bacterium]